MRGKYSIGLAILLAGAAIAAPCPPQIAETAQQVADLRGIDSPFLPPCRWIDFADLRSELDHKLRRDLPIDPELYLSVLVRLGLVDGHPEELYPRLLDYYVSQVLGFYEPDADEMVLVARTAANVEGSEMIWAHELAHAAQQRRWSLPSRLLAMRDNSDAQRAASAIAEGEAMLVMLLVGTGGSGDPLAGAEEALARQAAATPTPPGLARYFVADLVFPYTAGFAAVVRGYRAGGWAAVDRLLRSPPSSTAALLHPDRPTGTAAMTDDRLLPPPSGWEEILTDTLGEWGLRFLLSRGLAEEKAGQLAAGWSGDRLRLIRCTDRPERWALDWRLRCRTPRDRRALEAELRLVLPGSLSMLDGSGAPSSMRWQSDGPELEILAAWPE